MIQEEKGESLHFVKTNPSGNTTLLVLDEIPAERHKYLAPLLMDKNSLSAEQVAFLDTHPPRMCDIGIRMMGGEFCGNAVRSAAAWLVFDRCRWQPDLDMGYEAQFDVSCSGISHNVSCTVRQMSRHQFDVSAEMPLPLSIDEISIGGYSFCRVHLPGIVHFCLCGKETPDAETQQALIAEVLRTYPVQSGDAAGILFWNGHRLDPFVYVKDTDTLVHESSCGSGTAAVAACLAYRLGGAVHIDASQAGGMIYGEAEKGEGIVSLRIGGLVEITAEGIAYV